MTSKLKCPFCRRELKIAGEHTTIMSCFNGDCKGSGLYGEKEFWQELICTHKELEQSQACCSDWEKQALDYKAKDIALSGELERTRKALDIAWDGLKKIGSGNIIEHSVVGHENDNKIFIANKALDESKTALEQKDVK